MGWRLLWRGFFIFVEHFFKMLGPNPFTIGRNFQQTYSLAEKDAPGCLPKSAHLPNEICPTKDFSRNLPTSQTQRTQGRNIPVQGNPSLRYTDFSPIYGSTGIAGITWMRGLVLVAPRSRWLTRWLRTGAVTSFCATPYANKKL